MNTHETNLPQGIPAQAAQPVPPAAPAPPTGAPVRRSPGLAVVLSCFPGLGHLYLGLYNRAVMIFASFAICIWLSEHSGNLGIIIPFIVLFGFVDAYRQAQALNLGLAPEPLAGVAQTRPAPRSGRFGFGIFLLVIGVVLLYNQFYPIDFSFFADWWPLLLVIAGAWMLAAHFIEKQKRANRERDLDLPPTDPTRQA